MSLQSPQAQPRHLLFYELPISLKALYTMMLVVLGFGYLFALIQVYEVHAGRDGNAGLSVEDIRVAYNGSQADTRLEVAIKGPMARMMSEEQRTAVIAWVRDGAGEAGYTSDVEPIIKARCLACHNGSNPHVAKLTDYDSVKELAHLDTGVSINTLVRVSHIHLMGLTFVFGFMGIIFSHAYMKRRYLKTVIIVIPFLAILMDIASWWLTKVSSGFAYVVMIGGALMALSFAVQWVVSMYQMWFFRQCPVDEECIPH